jgi:hypothetical protein
MNIGEETAVERKKAVSVKFLVIAALLGLGAYVAGPYVMTYVMLIQEGVKAKAAPVQSEIPEGRPTLPTGN